MNDQQHPCPDEFPFSMFTFSTHENEPNSPIGRIIACVHAIWSHMGIAKLSGMSGLLRVCLLCVLFKKLKKYFRIIFETWSKQNCNYYSSVI